MKMRVLKHLPLDHWPAQDHAAFEAAYLEGDIFDEDVGPGAHLSPGSRIGICTGWRRWLAFLVMHEPAALGLDPADRITIARLRSYIEHLGAEDLRPTSIAIYLAQVFAAAKIVAPERDWRWLGGIVSRLQARSKARDRFAQLVPPWETLDHGFELMETAKEMAGGATYQREIQYRDGLMLAVMSYWPIRRRGFAALTITRHLRLQLDGAELKLFAEDAKEQRAEHWQVAEPLLPYLDTYLNEIRPAFPGAEDHDGLWASRSGRQLKAGQIYDRLRARTHSRFGKVMGLHDFRRAAATFIVSDAPDQVGIIPGVLQHASPATAEYYKQARAIQASRRAGETMAGIKDRLRPLLGPNKD